MSIEIQDLVYRYRARAALNHVSLSVQPGSVVGLLVANGAGKSTLLRILCGLLKPGEGTVRVGDRAAARAGPCARVHRICCAAVWPVRGLASRRECAFYSRAYGLEETIAAERVQEG